MDNKSLRCGAKTRSGHPCKKWPIIGRTRCRLHGGKSLFWIAHPSYKDGEYSKFSYAGIRRKIVNAGWASFKEKINDPMNIDRPHGRNQAPAQGFVAPVRCGAKNRNGNPCQKWPLNGRTRCKNHGGKSLRGVASPSFKNGRYSKMLPRDLIRKTLRFYAIEKDGTMMNKP